MNNKEKALFLVQLILGFIFFMHGLGKFQGGISNIAGWFASIGLPAGLAYVVATIELVGGLLMIAGLGTRVVAALFAAVMVGAIATVKGAAGLMGDGTHPGYEFELVLLVLSVFFVLAGPSAISLDRKLFKRGEQQ
ncbi:DoxX family protein [Aneurinibacillus uraniidurans]|uniref:DoxX family protein n=1 Tax=Aneurinibacillus uraniidurans TaxID=2966586 RepID=UPI002348F8F3|nr:DoxX family protein [Aneurinibacillus sp. B1]WCN37465.1 DoxX family protein [Aneurinibacillus sp. B1]